MKINKISKWLGGKVSATITDESGVARLVEETFGGSLEAWLDGEDPGEMEMMLRGFLTTFRDADEKRAVAKLRLLVGDHVSVGIHKLFEPPTEPTVVRADRMADPPTDGEPPDIEVWFNWGKPKPLKGLLVSALNREELKGLRQSRMYGQGDPDDPMYDAEDGRCCRLYAAVKYWLKRA